LPYQKLFVPLQTKWVSMKKLANSAFLVDELVNDISTSTTKQKVGKSSKNAEKLQPLLRNAMSSDDYAAYRRSLSEDELTLLNYAISNQDSNDEDIERMFLESAEFIEYAKLCMIMDAVIEKSIEHNAYTDEEKEFIDKHISNIHDRTATFYAYYKPKDSYELYTITHDPFIMMNLNWIDVSEIRTMCQLFRESVADWDISLWNLKSLEDADMMFQYAEFDGDISMWQFPSLKSAYSMFDNSCIKCDISKWEFPEVVNMTSMFSDAVIDCDISEWKFPKVETMNCMFLNATLHSDISKWRFPKVYNMAHMLSQATFDSDISKWEFPEVKDMSFMFQNTALNADISKWKFPKVKFMRRMFNMSNFNGDISGWDVSEVGDMESMFRDSTFTGDLSGWQINEKANIEGMFENCDIPWENEPKVMHYRYINQNI